MAVWWLGVGREATPQAWHEAPAPMFFSFPGHNNKGRPRTSYYQYGLGILALCVHKKRLHDSVVGKLLYAVEHEQHLYQGHLSVGEWGRPC